MKNRTVNRSLISKTFRQCFQLKTTWNALILKGIYKTRPLKIESEGKWKAFEFINAFLRNDIDHSVQQMNS